MVQIIVVHGRGTKPSRRCKLRYVREVLLTSVRRAESASGQWLAAHPGVVQLAYYADLTRRLLGEKPESCRDYREPIDRLYEESRSCPTGVSFQGFLRDLGADAAGVLERFLSMRTRRRWLLSRFPDVARYLSNDAFAASVRERLKKLLVPALLEKRRVLLIAHSLGSVVAYDVLWEISHRKQYRSLRGLMVDCFATMGSPLGDETVKKQLLGWRSPPNQRHPTAIRRWVNFSARGDVICHDAHLGNDFRLMRTRKLVESFTEKVNLCAVYRSREGQWNPHKLYGYLMLPEVGRLVADFLKEETLH